MFPGAEWLIPSVLSTVGGLFQNRSNAKMAQRQMDFQRDMSNSSFQRSREDMIRAGLNPAMMTHLGGASSPGGASAAMGNPLDAGVNSAQSARRVASEVRNAAQMTTASTEKMRAEAEVSRAQIGLINEDILSRQLDRTLRVAMQPADLRLRAAQALASEAAARYSGVQSDRSLRLLGPDVEATNARAALDRSNATLSRLRESGERMKSNVFRTGAAATGWFDQNVRTNAGDALSAGRGWASALESSLYGSALWMRNNFLNNQQPRAKSERRRSP